jgi:uncharacterized lipoprotein YbaY
MTKRSEVVKMMNKLEMQAIDNMSDVLYKAYMALPREKRVEIVLKSMSEAAQILNGEKV